MKAGKHKKTIQFLLTGILPILVVWGIYLFLLVNTPVLDIVRPNHTLPFGVYTDQEFGGNTEASMHQTTDGIIFEYELKQGYVFPYAGISFGTATGIAGIKPNSIFTIEIATATSNTIIPVLLNEGVTYNGTKLIRPVQYELKAELGQHVYHIPLNAFEVPAWWYKSNDLNKELPAFNAAKVQNICIQNSLLATLGKKDSIQIVRISNSPDTGFGLWLASLFSGCWLIGCGVYLFIQKKKQPIFIPYIPTESDEESEDAWGQIRTYISANYMNDIDMERMEKDLGIAKHKIAVLIKENTTLIFKQYLNQIKVAEAKRLLLETTLPIGEIADKVGFGHLSNFNRVFKQYTGESPSDLRKQVQTK